jgi:hypothetical protein
VIRIPIAIKDLGRFMPGWSLPGVNSVNSSGKDFQQALATKPSVGFGQWHFAVRQFAGISFSDLYIHQVGVL